MIQLLVRTLAVVIGVGGALIDTALAADPLPAETRLVSLANAPAPTTSQFEIATAQDLVVTLTDLQVPAALTSATVVVTQDDKISGNATLTAPATSASVDLSGATGKYTLRVFGAPGAAVSVGTFTACVAPKADPANCIQTASIAGNITAQSSANDQTLSTLSLNLVVTAQGTYTFTYADLIFPAALSSQPNFALFQGTTPVALSIVSGGTVDLSPGTYTLLGVAQADQTLKGGLYGITIAGAGGAPLLDDVIPVGLASDAAPFNNSSAQNVTLKVTDYEFPAAVGSASALLTSGGLVLGSASSVGGATSFAVPAGTLKLWTYASPGAGAGTYSVDLAAGGTTLYAAAQSVSASNSEFAYAFLTPALTAGTYQANAADLEFPSTLTGLSFAVAQNGVILQHSDAAGTFNFNAAAGTAVLLVSAKTPASTSSTGSGLFDVNVQTTGAGAALVIDKTQSVGSSPALFDSRQLTLGTNGSFDVSLSDLKIPAQLQNLALVVSRGTEVLGKVFGGGTFSFAGTPGAYQLTFVATPAADKQYGLYAVKAVVSPPLVTLTAAATSVVEGESVKLSWSSSGADTCTASGGAWTGNKAVSATDEVVVVSTTTTYTLTCTGSGGSSAKSVSVTATAKPVSNKGGGGAMEFGWLALFAAVWLRRSRA